MLKKVTVFIIVFSIIHFILSMISIINGMIIFKGPSTNSELMWAAIMKIFLFPSNILFQNISVENQWYQTIIIYFNSLICGGFISIFYFALSKRKK